MVNVFIFLVFLILPTLVAEVWAFAYEETWLGIMCMGLLAVDFVAMLAVMLVDMGRE